MGRAAYAEADGEGLLPIAVAIPLVGPAIMIAEAFTSHDRIAQEARTSAERRDRELHRTPPTAGAYPLGLVLGDTVLPLWPPEHADPHSGAVSMGVE